MKYFAFCGVLALLFSGCANLTASHDATATLSAPAILESMKKVADWQLTNASPSHYKDHSWTYGAFYAGVMALDGIAGTPKYHDAMVAKGKKFNWQAGPKAYHADDQCVGQMYLELYMKDHDPAMLAGIKAKLDNIL